MQAQSPPVVPLLPLLLCAGQGRRGGTSHTGSLKSSAKVLRVSAGQRDPGDGEEVEE